MAKTVLVIDDVGFDRTIISAMLAQLGYDVIGEASSGKEGLAMAKELSPDLITLDKLMPDMNGMEVLEQLHETKLPCKTVLVSGDNLDSVYDEAKRLGAVGFFTKPLNRKELQDELGALFD